MTGQMKNSLKGNKTNLKFEVGCRGRNVSTEETEEEIEITMEILKSQILILINEAKEWESMVTCLCLEF